MEIYYNFVVNNISLCIEIEVGCHILKNNCLFMLLLFKSNLLFKIKEKIVNNQGFIQEKIGFENGPFTKICYLKTDPKIKNYKVIFHIRSAANQFTGN